MKVRCVILGATENPKTVIHVLDQCAVSDPMIVKAMAANNIKQAAVDLDAFFWTQPGVHWPRRLPINDYVRVFRPQ